jgi:transposase
MIEAQTVDALSTIKLLESIEALYPLFALIHVFLDNASYHHAKIVREWLAQPGRRIKLHFIPAYCPHLNPIERLWGVMHRNVTHNKTYATCAPLPTLRRHPRGCQRTARGQCGLLLLHCSGLAPPTLCRFLPAHRKSYISCDGR